MQRSCVWSSFGSCRGGFTSSPGSCQSYRVGRPAHLVLVLAQRYPTSHQYPTLQESLQGSLGRHQQFGISGRYQRGMDSTLPLCLLVALLLVAHSVQGVVVSVAEGRQPWNIKGDVLVLDVSSLRYQGNHPVFPAITSADACEAYCMQTVGCSGWTFCSNKDGCGSGCDQYVAQNKPMTIPMGNNVNPTVPAKEWYQRTSIQSFGPWGPTANCKQSCGTTSDGSYSCKSAGKWPYGMCTLKVLKDAGKPQYWNQNAGEGWVSGWISIPSQCKGTTPRACQRCLQTPAPDKCITCALNPKLKISLLDQVLGGQYPLQAYDGCGSCYSTTNPDKCSDCLFNKKACAACATLTPQLGQKVDVLKCIDCSNKYGPTYTNACTECAELDAKQGAVDKCLGCVARASKVACSDNGWPTTCFNPATGSGVCATCASTAYDYETCVKCVERKPFSQDCGSCGTLSDAVQQTKCYNCVKTATSYTTACFDCINYLKDSKQVDQCYACVANPKTSAEGRQWCFGCQNWCNTFDTRGQCNTCLHTPAANYIDACACKS